MILILAPDCPEATLDAILKEAARLGWNCDVSRGKEQIAVGLTGDGDPRALEDALARRPEVDVLPILSREGYQRAINRRRMMGGLVGGLGLLTAMGAALPVVGFLLPPHGVLSDRNLIPAGSVSDLPEQGARSVEVLGHPVLLVRLEGERFFAVSAVCTHMNICRLEWNKERRQLVCPCHGGAFDVYGNVVQGPPSIPLRTYEVDVVDQDVLIRREA
jgi:Rieske Fe-S protein